MEEKKKKSTTKKNTSTKSTPKKSTSKKTSSTTKKKTSSTSKKTTSTKTSSTKKKSTTSTKKKTTSSKPKTTTKKSTGKTTTKKTTTVKKTSTNKTPVKKEEIKEVKTQEEPFEYTNSYTLTDIFDKHKKEENKIKPEDVVFEDEKEDIEDKLDKILSTIPEEQKEKEFVVEENTFEDVILTKEEIKEEIEKEEPIKKPVRRKRKLKNWVYIALIFIFSLIIIISIFKIVTHKPLNDLLNERYVHVLDGGYREYEIDFKGLKKLNKDTVGYVKLNATKINHVVVKGKDNNYYKNNNFMKKKSKNGWIYMDSRNKLDGTDKHIVIYGSNNKEIFGDLDKILSNKWQNNNNYHYITYVSENFENRYQVFSIYETDKADLKIDFNRQIDFANYIKEIIKKSNYDYNVKVDSYDNILTLVSLDGDKQIVLHAKLIKD